jgi:hypothetical protein
MNNSHRLDGFSSSSCVVSIHPETGSVSALRWNYKKNDWECFAEGTSRESANIIQSAYNKLPDRGGQLLIKSGEYLINKTLFFNRSHTDICFEAGAELKPTDDFPGFMIDLGGLGEYTENGVQVPSRVSYINIQGLHINGKKQCNGIVVHDANYFTFTNCIIEQTQGEAIWLRPHAIEGAFNNCTLEYTATNKTSPSMMIGADEETIDQANNIMFTNFRLIFPVGPIVINNPEGQIRPVRNLYFYGIQIHWLYDNNCKKYHPELVSHSHKQCDLIQILSGHDIHFLGGNFQFMDNKGTFITLGGKQEVHSITIKGKIWGGGSGSTHILVKNADHLFLPCTISNKSGTAIDWGKNKPQVHQSPVILEGEIHGIYTKEL